MVIWSKVKLGDTPDVNALAMLTVLVVSLGVGVAGWIRLRAERRQLAHERLAYSRND